MRFLRLFREFSMAISKAKQSKDDYNFIFHVLLTTKMSHLKFIKISL